VKSEQAAPLHPFTVHRSLFTSLAVYRSPFTLYFHAVLDQSSSPNVLAVRFSSIGDVLLITPLLRAIRHRYPGARITVLTKDSYVPLLSHNPHVNLVLGVAPNRNLTSLAADLRKSRYTHRLDLHDSIRTRVLRALVPGRWRTYPKHRLARSVLIRTKQNWYRDSRPVAERYFDAARDLDVTPDGQPPEFVLAPEAEQEVAIWLGPVDRRPVVALAPGAAHATKRWPLEHWRVLAQRLATWGFEVVVVGAEEDRSLGCALSEGAECPVANATGVFGLQGTGALLRRAAAVVSGDTGVMHMATAVGTPVVALFGPTVRQFGFFPYTSQAEVIELGLPCRPCSSKGGPRCPLGHHRCLRDIGPDLVLAALRRSIS
jgi:lipopolysaccharide heptosyltransferase II